MSANKTILLVDDNPSDVDLARRALEKARIAGRLAVAEDGKEALDYLFGTGAWEGRAVSDLPALTLLDLKLPKVSGLEVLRRIRADERTRRLPVVVFTSSGELEDLAASYDLGANGYVRKPVDSRRLTLAMERIGAYWLALNEPPPG
jgi:two-component system response regulator